jgi:ABC-type Fe3+-hydroxamate transport system substrate-binding protein
MKILIVLALLSPVLSACISSSSPAPPAKETTVIVPENSRTVVVCADGTHPPCN